jgi:type I restriction enzyme S subunit
VERYAEYKDTGIKTIGKIPTDWETIKTAYAFSFGRGLSISRENMSDEGVPCVHYGEIHARYGFAVDPATDKLPCIDESYIQTAPQALLKYGDYCFVGSSEDTEGSGNFTYLNSEVTTFAGSDTIILRTKREINYRFVAYMFDSLSFREQIRPEVYGVKVFHPTQSIIKRVIGIYPSLGEQVAIAAYLDHRTAEIDEVLADLQSQAEMLDTYKRELIAEVVTKGFDKSAPMRDSGAGWIGKVPAHWKITRIGSLYSERSTKVSDVDYPALSVTKNGIVPQLESVALTDHGDNRKLVKAGDFVINSRSDRRGSCGISSLDGSVTLISIVLKPNGDIYNPYYNYIFRSVAFADEFYKWGYGIVNDLWSTKWSAMKVISIQNPPIEEQRRIADYLDRKIPLIEGLIADIKSQIDKLKQYRQIVIHDAVTGKVKVTEG